MKGYTICVVAFIVFALLLLPVAMSTRSIAGRHSTAQPRARAGTATGRAYKAPYKSAEALPHRPRLMIGSANYKASRKAGAETVEVAGSSLPDCSHACGSCRPCRLVMVSFVCASLAEAETCPMAYKCMCRNKSFPVP